MRKINLVIISFVLATVCCNSNKRTTDDSHTTPFAGNWISLNYLDSFNKYGTPGKIKNIDLDEIVINYSGDSLCLNKENIETPVFKIVEKSATGFRINRLNQDDFTMFSISENGKELSFIYKKYNQKFRFFKAEPKYAVKIVNGWATAAQLFFNERIIAANYDKLNSDGNATAKVSFTSYGKIEGLQGYNKFSICYQGDCSNMTDDDMITLSDGNTSDNFIYQWNNDTLIFYSTSNISLRNEMPYYVKAMEIFRFKKQM